MELVLWVAPLRVIPVVSYEDLKKGVIDRPKSGLDRFNLTEVGELLIAPHLKNGGYVRLRDVHLPFPWKAELMTEEGLRMRLDAFSAGKSTFRSLIRISFDSGNGVAGQLKEILQILSRDPLSTPYWDMNSWEIFHRDTGLTFDDLRRTDERTISEIGL